MSGDVNEQRLFVFYCVNTEAEAEVSRLAAGYGLGCKFVKLACSAMVRDVYLLKAFEAGADAVLVLVCPEGRCRYLEGNLRARKRVEFVRRLLDDVGVGKERLAIYNLSAAGELPAMVQGVAEVVARLGPSPARV